jgi:hypothetical protein
VCQPETRTRVFSGDWRQPVLSALGGQRPVTPGSTLCLCGGSEAARAWDERPGGGGEGTRPGQCRESSGAPRVSGARVTADAEVTAGQRMGRA